MVYTRSQARHLAEIVANIKEEMTPQEEMQDEGRSTQEVDSEPGPSIQTAVKQEQENFGERGTSSAKPLPPFCSIPVDNREYAGFIINEDLGKKEVQIKFRNEFWHFLKVMTGSVIRVKVQPVELKNAEDGSKAMQFIVCNYATVRGKFINQDVASVDIVSKPGVGSTFKFHIINSKLAAANRVNLYGLIASCETVFSTLLIRPQNMPEEELKKYAQEKMAGYEMSSNEMKTDEMTTD